MADRNTSLRQRYAITLADEHRVHCITLWRVEVESLGGAPEGTVEGIDGGLLEVGLGEECGQGLAHAVADSREVGEDAAGVGDFDGQIEGLVETPPSGGDLDGEVLAGLIEGAVGDGVSGGGGLGDDGDEGGEVWVRELVDEGDEVVEGGETPMVLDGFEEGRGGVASG